MATTPGIIVSEEPQSPISNLVTVGLNSQRSEFCRCSQLASPEETAVWFPETHYTPILDAVERIELILAVAALQFGTATGWSLNLS